MVAYSKMAEWAAWYSGEPSRLIDVYSGVADMSTGQTPWWRFWTRARAVRDGAQRAMLHVPLASDLAGTSAALLFGEAPSVRVAAAREDGTPQVEMGQQPPADPFAPPKSVLPGVAPAPRPAGHNPFAPPDPANPATAADAEAMRPKPKPETKEQKAEARLREIIEEGDFNVRLLEAAESAAALGGVYIYPTWDKDLRDFPFLAIAQADQALPEFVHGYLRAVTFWRVVEKDDQTVWRHLERHEVEGTGDSRKCVVYNKVYKGTTGRLGTAVEPGSSSLPLEVEDRVELPFKELDVEYVPNIRPNRLWRSSALGVSDFQGAETLLDALDETYASWMRDIRLAKARIIVPREYLRVDKDGKAGMDIDQEIYTTLDMDPGMAQDARAMMPHQFEIRYLEHQATSIALIDRIVSNAGYTPESIRGAGDRPNGTALRIAEHKTLLTLRRKSGWWTTAIANVLKHMLEIDKEVFGGTAEPIRPAVKMSDAIIDNPLELAQTALALKTAESASIETRVRMVHPEWSESEVDAEVARIQGDLDAAKPPVPTVIGATGGAKPMGRPGEDPASTDKVPVTDQTKGPAPANRPPASPPLARNAQG